MPPAIYRVLLPNCLQVDPAVAPSSDFAQRSPRFRLLFGTHRTVEAIPSDPTTEFAFAVLYAIEARRDIERGESGRHNISISLMRDHTLTLACVNRGLAERHGKGYDHFPLGLLEAFEETLVGSVAPAAQRDALARAVRLLLDEAGDMALATDLAHTLTRSQTASSPDIRSSRLCRHLVAA